VGHRIRDGFPEGAPIHRGHGHAEHAHLQLMLGHPRGEQFLDPLEDPQQWAPQEVVDAYVSALQHLKGYLVGGHVLAKHGLRAQEEKPRDGGEERRPLAPHEPERGIELRILQTQEGPIAAEALDGAAQPDALLGIEVGR